MRVVLPLRNGAEHLHEFLQSISAQSLRDFELLVVDDGSVDAGPELVRQCAREDARIHLLRQPAMGIVAALNYGLRHAQAVLVARMDADDVMYPQRLELQLAQMRARADLTLVACCADAFPDDAIGKGMREYLRCQKLFEYGQRVSAWVDIDPRKIGQRIANVPVHGPKDWPRRVPSFATSARPRW